MEFCDAFLKVNTFHALVGYARLPGISQLFYLLVINSFQRNMFKQKSNIDFPPQCDLISRLYKICSVDIFHLRMVNKIDSRHP